MKKIILSVFIIIFAGCSESSGPSSSDDVHDYQPKGTGSWWKYDNYSYDSSGTDRELVSVDSVVLSEVEVIADTTILIFTEHSLTDAVPPTTYSYKIFENKVFTNNMNPLMSMILQEDMLLLDMDVEEWTAIPESHMDMEIFGYEMKGDYSGTGYQSEIERLNINNNKVDCRKLYYDFVWEGTVKIPQFPFAIPAEIKTKSTVWIGLKTGLVKIYNDSAVLETGIIDYGVMNPSSQILIDYEIMEYL